MSEIVVNLDEVNQSLEDTLKKLAFVQHCVQNQKFEPLLNIGPYHFDLEERDMGSDMPPQEDIILSTYFSSYPDPQRGNHIDENDFDYIKPLYQSVFDLGLGCIIFYDNLSQEFVDHYSTDNIKFINVTLGNLSLNDERNLIYYAYILTHATKIKNVLMVDVSDVYIFKNPFDLVRNHDNTLFLGRSNLELVKDSYVNYTRSQKFGKDAGIQIPSQYFSMRLFNAGTIGGSIHVVLYLLRQMTYFFKCYSTNRNHNMTVLNYCVFLYFQESQTLNKVYFLRLRQFLLKIASLVHAKMNLNILPASYQCKNENYSNGVVFAGFPFTSKFKKYEMDSKAYLIHK